MGKSFGCLKRLLSASACVVPANRLCWVTTYPKAVHNLGNRLLHSTASHYSINRLTEYLRSIGHKVTKEFVSQCLAWFEDAYFLFSLKIFDASVAKQNVNTKKIYCIDHALCSSVISHILTDKGHALENAVFMHLRRHYWQIHYYRTHTGKEVDFIYLDDRRRKHLVQVCYSMDDPATRKRELVAMEEAMEELKADEGVVVTFQEEGTESLRGKKIAVVPVWKYLIGIMGSPR